MTTHQDIIDQVSRRLRDVNTKTWKLDILAAAMNSAFQTVVNTRPDSSTEHRNIALVEGYEQEIDDDLYKLIHLLSNVCPLTGKPKRAITLADMGTMDSVFMHWRQDAARGYIEHYMLDDMNDRKFYVWPPAVGPLPVPDEVTDPTLLGTNVPALFLASEASGDAPVIAADGVTLSQNLDGGGYANFMVNLEGRNKTDGIRYVEIEILAKPGTGDFEIGLGVTTDTTPARVGFNGNDNYGWYNGGNVRRNSGSYNNVDDFDVGDVLGIEYNLDTGVIGFYKNGGPLVNPSITLSNSHLAISLGSLCSVAVRFQEDEWDSPPANAQSFGTYFYTQADLDAYNAYLAALAANAASIGDETVRGVFAKVPCLIDTNRPTAGDPPTDPGAVTPETAAQYDTDPADIYGYSVNHPTFTIGNTRAFHGGGATGSNAAVIEESKRGLATSGQWYWEVELDSYTNPSTNDRMLAGISQDVPIAGSTGSGGNGGNTIGVQASVGSNDLSDVYSGGTLSFQRLGSSMNEGDVGRFLFDADARTLSFAREGEAFEVVASGIAAGAWFPYTEQGRSGAGLIGGAWILRTVPSQFSYTIPTGAQIFGDLEVTQEQVDAYNTALAAYNAEVAALAQFANNLYLDDDMAFNKTHWPAIMEWMLYYCYAVDDEQTPNQGRADRHFRNFFNLMGVKIQNSLRIQQVREDFNS